MKYRLSIIAILATVFAGISTSHAEENFVVKGYDDLIHFTYIDWAYFSGGGFKSGPESYGGFGNEAAWVPMAGSAPVSEAMPTGHHFTLPEYLYFTGQGFSSGGQVEK